MRTREREPSDGELAAVNKGSRAVLKDGHIEPEWYINIPIHSFVPSFLSISTLLSENPCVTKVTTVVELVMMVI